LLIENRDNKCGGDETSKVQKRGVSLTRHNECIRSDRKTKTETIFTRTRGTVIVPVQGPIQKRGERRKAGDYEKHDGEKDDAAFTQAKKKTLKGGTMISVWSAKGESRRGRRMSGKHDHCTCLRVTPRKRQGLGKISSLLQRMGDLGRRKRWGGKSDSKERKEGDRTTSLKRLSKERKNDGGKKTRLHAHVSAEGKGPFTYEEAKI